MEARKLSKTFLIVCLALVSVLICSCGSKKTPKFVIGNDFYYWESDADSDYDDAVRNADKFKKLTAKNANNLLSVLGPGAHYVWVRADFEIPDYLKDASSLGLVIPHLRFAAQLYLNGTFLAQCGDFPPNERSSLYKANFFQLPAGVFAQEGGNTILMRIYAQGLSGISTRSYIHPTDLAFAAFEEMNFMRTRIYLLFAGMMIFTFVLYMALYAAATKLHEFRDFALLNLFTALFLSYFFATEFPLYSNAYIPFLPFVKLSLYIPSFFIVHFATHFVYDFLQLELCRPFRITDRILLATQIIATIAAPTYAGFMLIAPLLLIPFLFHIFISGKAILRRLFDKERRMLAIFLMIGFIPFNIGAIVDIAVRICDNTKDYPFLSIFGWQISTIVFIIILSLRFSDMYKRDERLTNQLQEEVSDRTKELQGANLVLSLLNERLERDKKHSEMDLEMAAIVQRNFFPRPNKQFLGWEISVCYSPASKVSGDFYDYYNYNDILNGISLFDVSGHGLSASLVTMLSKSIIAREFQSGFRKKDPIDKVLNKINNMILYEKGDIDNYMTGILCRFDDSFDPKNCSVELGNAGHPYPLKFSIRDNEVYELKSNDGKQHYGAIGMRGINVSFARSIFSMSTGDILVLYTDGLTETSNSRQEQFGVERLKKIVKENHTRPPSEIVGHIIAALEEFSEFRPYDDDITLLIAKRTNASEYNGEDAPENDYEELEEADAGIE